MPRAMVKKRVAAQRRQGVTFLHLQWAEHAILTNAPSSSCCGRAVDELAAQLSIIPPDLTTGRERLDPCLFDPCSP
jgi:hypothetical protein